MPGFVRRHAKVIPLIAGFLFGMVGGIWSFAVDHRLGEELGQLTDARADINEQVRTLNAAASEYFIANQQGDLIFVLAHQSDARAGIAQLIYKGGLLDRAEPVRNMIGALAIARQLDYRATYDAYKKLNDEARANFTLETFARLKRTEREIIRTGQGRVTILMNAGFALDRAITANKLAQRKNGVIGLVSSLAGGFLLLLANLIASRQTDETREPVKTRAADGRPIIHGPQFASTSPLPRSIPATSYRQPPTGPHHPPSP